MYKYVKRMIDFVLAIVFVIILAIPMTIVAFCIKLEDGRTNILYTISSWQGPKTF